MKTRLILRPGSKGTRKLLAQYGRRLVCVRYRYDPRRQRRFKTTELIVEESHWEPKSPRPETPANFQTRDEEATGGWQGKTPGRAASGIRSQFDNSLSFTVA